jgi:hypothetical protein
VFQLTLSGKIVQVTPPAEQGSYSQVGFLGVEERIFRGDGATTRFWWVRVGRDEWTRRIKLLKEGSYIGVMAFDLEIETGGGHDGKEITHVAFASKLFIL